MWLLGTSCVLVRMINSASPGLLRVGGRPCGVDSVPVLAAFKIVPPWGAPWSIMRWLVVGAGGVALLVVGRGGAGFGC